jgi:dTDP-4-dehydrorhamnose 3,5-epimerase
MKKANSQLTGLVVLEPPAHSDERGFFLESFNARHFADLTGLDPSFVQDNHSRSSGHVLRGLHYQVMPRAQGKLVQVIRGGIFDVAVDIRRASQTFGEWFGLELSESNHRQLWIPAGFAHGFLALTNPVDVIYKVTEYYSREHDRSIRWDDPDIGIEWPLDGQPILSDRDAIAPYLWDSEVFG